MPDLGIRLRCVDCGVERSFEPGRRHAGKPIERWFTQDRGSRCVTCYRVGRIAVGTAARDEAIDRVEQHALPSWWELAWRAINTVARQHREWTTDEVWAALEAFDAPAPPEPRAMGAVMRHAGTRGVAAPTDRTVLSTRPDCHRRPIRVWRTLTPGLDP